MELVWIVLIFVGLIVLYYFWSRLQPTKPGTPRIDDDAPDVFDFEEDTNQLAPNVRRKVHIIAPQQTVRGEKHRLSITAEKPPALQGVQPPAAKNITLDVLAIEPVVRLADTGEAIYDFDPPLELTINYKPSDAEKTTFDENGKPRLAIITGYESSEGWQFKRLDTTVTPNPNTGGGTLTASVKTLHPQDPAWVGHP